MDENKCQVPDIQADKQTREERLEKELKVARETAARYADEIAKLTVERRELVENNESKRGFLERLVNDANRRDDQLLEIISKLPKPTVSYVIAPNDIRSKELTKCVTIGVWTSPKIDPQQKFWEITIGDLLAEPISIYVKTNDAYDAHSVRMLAKLIGDSVNAVVKMRERCRVLGVALDKPIVVAGPNDEWKEREVKPNLADKLMDEAYEEARKNCGMDVDVNQGDVAVNIFNRCADAVLNDKTINQAAYGSENAPSDLGKMVEDRCTDEIRQIALEDYIHNGRGLMDGERNPDAADTIMDKAMGDERRSAFPKDDEDNDEQTSQESIEEQVAGEALEKSYEVGKEIARKVADELDADDGLVDSDESVDDDTYADPQGLFKKCLDTLSAHPEGVEFEYFPETKSARVFYGEHKAPFIAPLINWVNLAYKFRSPTRMPISIRLVSGENNVLSSVMFLTPCVDKDGNKSERALREDEIEDVIGRFADWYNSNLIGHGLVGSTNAKAGSYVTSLGEAQAKDDNGKAG